MWPGGTGDHHLWVGREEPVEENGRYEDGDTMGKLRDMVGLFLLGVGVIGCLLPVVPGVPFLLGAIVLLGPNHPRIRPWINRIHFWRGLMRKHGTQGIAETHSDAGDFAANSLSGG